MEDFFSISLLRLILCLHVLHLVYTNVGGIICATLSLIIRIVCIELTSNDPYITGHSGTWYLVCNTPLPAGTCKTWPLPEACLALGAVCFFLVFRVLLSPGASPRSKLQVSTPRLAADNRRIRTWSPITTERRAPTCIMYHTYGIRERNYLFSCLLSSVFAVVSPFFFFVRCLPPIYLV